MMWGHLQRIFVLHVIVNVTFTYAPFGCPEDGWTEIVKLKFFTFHRMWIWFIFYILHVDGQHYQDGCTAQNMRSVNILNGLFFPGLYHIVWTLSTKLIEANLWNRFEDMMRIFLVLNAFWLESRTILWFFLLYLFCGAIFWEKLTWLCKMFSSIISKKTVVLSMIKTVFLKLQIKMHRSKLWIFHWIFHFG